ncbi:hypothetical protein [Cesiribacter sp. SM1]|uniref:hypothetical protein n=1 Tax=Cesiribacter sp. SM1 TaxID=2861196 RepID=UPI001CD28F0E|nr:hypothetical protein [Cesiribacter sp. SM1]
MSEQEYRVLDELYFLQSYQELRELTEMGADELREVLETLLRKGWIKCMRSREGEEPANLDEFSGNYQAFLYLATKAGLLAHNTR